MLELDVRIDDELFDNKTQKFFYKTERVRLEHSLLTVSRWEAKYKKAFLSDLPAHAKTEAETLDYIRMMVLDDITEDLFQSIITNNIAEVNEYISDPQTATTIVENKNQSKSSEVITSEVIYYWMFSSQIPKECEQWHLHRLITLIRVFSAKQAKPEKRSPQEVAARNRALNAERRAKMNSKG